MRVAITFVLGLFVLSLAGVSCRIEKQTPTEAVAVDTPVVVQQWENLTQAGRFYFGGQPNQDMLQWLADEGVKVVINLRTDSEIETHTEKEYDEQALAEELGMIYLHFPMGGSAGYSPQVVDTLAQTLEEYPDKTFIHCAVGGRVGYLWIAYLINYKGQTIDDAVDIGRNIRYFSALEKLLGFELSMRRKN